MTKHTFTALFPFCGLGAGARGFVDAGVRILGTEARFRSVGGIDLDPESCADFEMLTGSPALCADVATLTPGELLRFAGLHAPDVVFMSPPCKGFSGLLSKKAARSAKYQRMNRLVLDWTRLMLEAWGDDPPGLVLLENVPRIASRGKPLLGEVKRLLRGAGYVFHASSHDCGEIGGLAQHRRRFLLVARHPRKVPPLLYQPPKRRVRACGEVLGDLPMPEDPTGGRLHVMPRISWLNWIRLALIPAGGDWRDLEGVLEEGQARREVHKRHAVEPWDEPTGTVAGSGSNGVANVADPRLREWFGGTVGVLPWGEPAGTVTGAAAPTRGRFSVADPRLPSCHPNRHHNKYVVLPWDEAARTVIGATRPGSGGMSVADPRVKRAYDAGYAVLRWDQTARTIAGQSAVGCGAYAVADPRVGCEPRAGAYGVLSWDDPARTVTGHARVDNGAFAVADPRKPPPVTPVIIASDGTWHRPLTTLELAALQGMPASIDGKPLELAGRRVSAWRERIGNAVPCPAAQAIADQMLVALTESALGGFSMQGGSVWVAPEVEVLDG